VKSKSYYTWYVRQNCSHFSFCFISLTSYKLLLAHSSPLTNISLKMKIWSPSARTNKKMRFSTYFAFVFLGAFICFSQWEQSKGMMRYLFTENSYDPEEEKSNILLARNIIYRYVKHNSKEAVKKNPNGRRYLVSSYSCPHQAGNRLHKFFNEFLMAVATNRTFLWSHCRGGVCTNQGRSKDGTWEDCEKFIRIADWVPKYNKTIHGEMSPVQVGWPLSSEVAAQVDLATEPVIYLDKYKRWQMSVFGTIASEKGASILSPLAHRRAKTLFAAGFFHAYGMAWEKLFQLSDEIQPSPELVKKLSNDQTLTLALHSRHQNTQMVGNGTNIKNEMACLSKLLSIAQPTSLNSTEAERECIVVVMTDSAKAMEGLEKQIPTDLKCKVVTTDHNETKTSYNGDFSGGEYFRDLALAQYVTGGVCMTGGSTASPLMAYLVQERRVWAGDSAKHLATHEVAPMPACVYQPTKKDLAGVSCFTSTNLFLPEVEKLLRGRKPQAVLSG